jgi:hypothetical protein
MEPGIPGCCWALISVMQNAECRMQTMNTARQIDLLDLRRDWV